MQIAEPAEAATLHSPAAGRSSQGEGQTHDHDTQDGLRKQYMIEAKNITKIYDASRTGADDGGPKAAVDDVSFHVEQGEMFVIMGLSGSGKSTLLRMLNRLIEPTAGSLSVSGKDAFNLSANDLRTYRNETVNMVFQHFAIFPHRTVVENVAYGLKVRGVSKSERRRVAMEALSTVGLDEWANHYPSSLSGGMRQRVGLARGIVTDADVILMDEPFSALDPLIRADMQEFLIKLHRELKKTVVFVTHDLNEAMKLGDRVMVMKEGRVVQLGSVDELLNNPIDEYVAKFTSDVDRSRIITASALATAPEFTASTDRPLLEALEGLRQSGQSRCYVVNTRHELVGTVSLPDLERAAMGGAEALNQVVATDQHSETTPDVELRALFSRIDAHDVPLAVVNTSRELIGVLPRHTFLHALSGPQSEVE